MNAYEIGVGYTYFRMEKVGFYICYILPNITVADFGENVQRIMAEVRRRGEEVIVVGDFNAKSLLRQEMPDGKFLLNGPRLWTWWPSMMVSNLPSREMRAGLSLMSPWPSRKIAEKISGWKILLQESFSLHQYLVYEVQNGL